MWDTVCDRVASHISPGVSGLAPGRVGCAGGECMVDAVELEKVEELDDMDDDGASSPSGGLAAGIVDEGDEIMRYCWRTLDCAL